MASSFNTLRQRGYGTVYAIRIEGIPYIFHEGPTPYRVDSESFPSAGSGYTASASFMILKDTSINQEIDRGSSVSRGKTLDITLDWDVLEEEGILDDLFRRPDYYTTLRADISATEETIPVESVTGFAAAGQFYIGRELVKYTGVTGGGSPSFDIDTGAGGARGYLGYKYMFQKDDPGSHGIITPTPLAWKGRFITVYEHLLSPEGRILDSTWGEGTYQRELWKGYVNAPPFPSAFGMTLTAMPLMRLAAQELGASLTGLTIGIKGMNVESITTGESISHVQDFPIYVAAGASVHFNFIAQDFDSGDTISITRAAPPIIAGAASGDWPTLPPGAMTIRQYCEAAAKYLDDEFTDTKYSITNVSVGSTSAGAAGKHDRVEFLFSTKFPAAAGTLFTSLQMKPSSGCYWFVASEVFEMPIPSSSGGDIGNAAFGMPCSLSNPGAIAVKDIEGKSVLDFTFNATGLGVVDAGDFSEVIEWDAKYSADYLGNDLSPYAVLRISKRMVGAEYGTVTQQPANLNESGKIDVVSGVIDTLSSAAAKFLQSSGTGTRGASDTLGLGFGYGIPSDFIALGGTGGASITNEEIPLLAIGRASWLDMFSGWYGVSGICLVMRRALSDGVLKLMNVDTAPAKVLTGVTTDFGFELAKSDVVVGGTEVPRLIVAPNQIVIDTSAGPYESAQYTYNAVGRIQAEGATSISLSVPGGRPEIVSPAILSIMARGLGQSIIQFKVAPWVTAELGDPVAVTVAHPILFDWSDGTRQPSNVPGRVVGIDFKLRTGEQTLTIILDGLLEPGFWLCPTTQVASVAGDDVTVADGSWFRSGETVRFYTEGNEGSEDVSIVATTVSGNVLSLASTPPGWIDSTTFATYPIFTSGSTEQTAAFMYDRDDKAWR